MNRLPVTADEISDAIYELHAVLPKFGLGPETMPKLIRLYREALTPYDGEAVRGGAKLLTRTAERFPTPAAWREAVREWIKRNRTTLERHGATDSDGRDVVCPTCRSVPRWAWLRMHVTPFSLPRPEGALMVVGDAIMRCIAACDPSRHQPGDCITPVPENFIEWVTVGA